MFLLQYPTASFSVLRWTADEFEGMSEIRVGGPLTGLPPIVSPGLTTRSQVLIMLGPSDYRPHPSEVLADSTVLIYQLPSGTDLIALYVVRDTVRVLRWRFRMG
ncbi:MAG TPA: hypothetical protein VJL31_02005 [Gemmatimonadales bacterium]|nr:hypothetical protein [Gemmatimonadales bacterium]